MNEMRKLMEAASAFTSQKLEMSGPPHGIEWMTLINVESESREWAEFDVYADDLAFAYPDIEVKELDPDAFFDLACEYLESYEDDVISTDQAKIGQWQSSSPEEDDTTTTEQKESPMNEMRKLMNLVESVQRVDEAAPALSDLGMPREMIRAVMSKFSLRHDRIDPQPIPQRPTAALMRNGLVLRKTRGGEWYAIGNPGGRRGIWYVITPSGEVKSGNSFSEVRPYFGSGASEYWHIRDYVDTRTPPEWRERERTGDPLQNDFASEDQLYDYLNRAFLPGIRRRAESVIQSILGNISEVNRKLEVTYQYRDYTDQERERTTSALERSVDLVRSIDRLLDEGFNKKTLAEFLRSARGHSRYWDIYNVDSILNHMSDRLGRQELGKAILSQLNDIKAEFEEILQQSQGE